MAVTKLPPVSEKEFMADLKTFAVGLGWSFYHPYLSIRSEQGFPDVTLVRERIVFAELKRVGGKPTEAQVRWMGRLRDAGAEVYLWTPDDWGSIAEVLSGRKVIGGVL